MKILLIMLIILLNGCLTTLPGDSIYTCTTDNDCVSTCGEGCVNSKWAESYEDTCANIRAWDCTCVNNQCYTDGEAP